jgi:polyisoprenoid-binding protein YceI
VGRAAGLVTGTSLASHEFSSSSDSLTAVWPAYTVLITKLFCLLNGIFSEVLAMTMSEPLASPAVQALLDESSLAGHWVLDPARSSVELHTRHTWGLRPLTGIFGEVSGAGTVSPDGQVAGTLTVKAASVDTRNSQRDKDLRSKRFFDVGNYSDITFAVDQVAPDGEGITAHGGLTVRDVTRPLSFPVQVTVLGDDELAIEGEAQIDRKDFGLTVTMMGMAPTHNTIVVRAVFTRH